MRTFERKRKALIQLVSARLDGVDDSRVTLMIKRYCRRYGIPATDQDIQDVANEAIRRRMITVIKLLRDRVTTLEDQIRALNQKVNSYHR